MSHVILFLILIIFLLFLFLFIILVKEKDSSPISAPMTVTEDGDPGHRHFSSMHWLYPGTFLPSDENMSGMVQKNVL